MLLVCLQPILFLPRSRHLKDKLTYRRPRIPPLRLISPLRGYSGHVRSPRERDAKGYLFEVLRYVECVRQTRVQ